MASDDIEAMRARLREWLSAPLITQACKDPVFAVQAARFADIHALLDSEARLTAATPHLLDMWAEQFKAAADLRLTVARLTAEVAEANATVRKIAGLEQPLEGGHSGPDTCPTYYDGCNCTLSTLVSFMERAEKAEAAVAEAKKQYERYVMLLTEEERQRYAEMTRAEQAEAALAAAQKRIAVHEEWERDHAEAHERAVDDCPHDEKTWTCCTICHCVTMQKLAAANERATVLERKLREAGINP